MIQHVTIETILDPSFRGMPLLDIRSPKEFIKGHIPGAISMPLFTDDERALVGTTYHKAGRQPAILKGFDITGPKWADFIKSALEYAPAQKLLLHCWRGGMRSEAMAWALSLYGFEVYVIQGGYKAFRRWAHQRFAQPLDLIVLAGKTGSNKTGLLHQLQDSGEQVLDLEALACHQGSAFGSMGRLIQPSQEQFENNLAWDIQALELSRPVWIEDESITIGRMAIPQPLWRQLCAAPQIELMAPLDSRVEVLYQQYGLLDKAFLASATLKIKKRLGPDQTKAAIEAIDRADMRCFIRRVLTYYDKAYEKSRKPARTKAWVEQLSVTDAQCVEQTAPLLIALAKQHLKDNK